MKIVKFLLFNPLIRGQLKGFKSFGFDPSNRAASMGLELVYILSVFVPWIFPIFILNRILKPTLVIGQPFVEHLGLLDTLENVLGSLILIGLLNKDFFNGQSPIKRIGGYQVVDVKTVQPANKIKCLLRNITAPIWPIELVMIWINSQRRLGDYIAGTKVIEVSSSDPENILNEMQGQNINGQTVVIIGIAIIIVIGYTTKFW
jgi:uncharacterized RDD family membrane protein YckC